MEKYLKEHYTVLMTRPSTRLMTLYQTFYHLQTIKTITYSVNQGQWAAENTLISLNFRNTP